MTFKDVIVKNFLGQLRKYLAYFISCTFCILFFFIYATLVFNVNLQKSDAAEMLSYVMPVSIICIFFFSIFFTSYAHSSFIKGRNLEFGVYITLGMSQKDLCRMVLYENMMIAGISMVVGIGAGTLFSRLFQMLVADLFGMEPMDFYLDYRSFLVTIGLFLLVFGFNILRSTYRLKRSNIQQMIMEARKTQGRKNDSYNKIFGLIGILMMLVSLVYLLFLCKNPELLEKPVLLMFYLFVAFCGLYLATSFGGNFILYALKKTKFYWNHLLTITDIHYRYRQNQTVIFVLSILISVTIFIVASPYSLIQITEDIATEQGRAAHIDYCYVGEEDSDYLTKYKETFHKDDIKKEVEIPFLVLTYNGIEVPVISNSEYNLRMNTDEIVAEGTCFNELLTWIPGNGGVNVNDIMTFTDGERNFELQAIFSNRGSFVAKSFPAEQLIVVNDHDYETIKEGLPKSSQGSYRLTYLNDWKEEMEETITFYKEVKAEAKGIKSVAFQYEDYKRGYTVFFFVCGMLGILFFIAGGSVLYFKQYTEIGETKRTFHKLYKLGISEKEKSRLIGKQLLVVFLLPMVFGSFLGLSLIYMMTHIVGGQESIRPFMKNASLVVSIYFVFQMIFFWITKIRYQKELHIS